MAYDLAQMIYEVAMSRRKARQERQEALSNELFYEQKKNRRFDKSAPTTARFDRYMATHDGECSLFPRHHAHNVRAAYIRDLGIANTIPAAWELVYPFDANDIKAGTPDCNECDAKSDVVCHLYQSFSGAPVNDTHGDPIRAYFCNDCHTRHGGM